MTSGEPVPVAGLLQETFAARGWQRRFELARLVERWPEVAGEQVAAHSRPVALSDDATLVVITDSATWATELTFLQAVLKERIAAVCGPALVTHVQVRTDEARTRGRRERG